MDSTQRDILEAILEAKEKRVVYQRQLLEKYNVPLVSFSLNIPGPQKENQLWLQVHTIGIMAIQEILKKEKITVIHHEVKKGAAGPIGFFSIDYDAIALKKIAVDIEETHPLGRIFDIDVLDKSGRPISRTVLNIGDRSCLLCHDKPAILCRRSQKHTLEEVLGAIYRIVEEYGMNKK